MLRVILIKICMELKVCFTTNKYLLPNYKTNIKAISHVLKDLARCSFRSFLTLTFIRMISTRILIFHHHQRTGIGTHHMEIGIDA